MTMPPRKPAGDRARHGNAVRAYAVPDRTPGINVARTRAMVTRNATFYDSGVFGRTVGAAQVRVLRADVAVGTDAGRVDRRLGIRVQSVAGRS